MNRVDLNSYDNSFYKPGPALSRMLWYIIGALVFQTYLFPFSGMKRGILRLFGAQIGRGVVIKPNVRIKYPWFLEVGDYTWIGESVWIDNLAAVRIGANVCLSQAAMLLTGNHDFKKPTFDLMVEEIIIEEGAWIGAHAVVCPGVHCGTHAVLAVGSIANGNLEPYTIYRGNPAQPVRERIIE